MKKLRRHSCSSENRLEKSTKNLPKMFPGGSLRVLGDLSGASQGLVERGVQTKRRIKDKLEGFWQAPGRSREAPGDPRGTPKSTKDRLPVKKALAGAVFVRFCTAFLALFHSFHVFGVIFSLFPFFSTMQTSRNTVIYNGLNTFSLFAFCPGKLSKN